MMLTRRKDSVRHRHHRAPRPGQVLCSHSSAMRQVLTPFTAEETNPTKGRALCDITEEREPGSAPQASLSALKRITGSCHTDSGSAVPKALAAFALGLSCSPGLHQHRDLALVTPTSESAGLRRGKFNTRGHQATTEDALGCQD